MSANQHVELKTDTDTQRKRKAQKNATIVKLEVQAQGSGRILLLPRMQQGLVSKQPDSSARHMQVTDIQSALVAQ